VIPLEAMLLFVVRLDGLVARKDVQFAEAIKVLPGHLQVATHWIAASADIVMLVVRFAG